MNGPYPSWALLEEICIIELLFQTWIPAILSPTSTSAYLADTATPWGHKRDPNRRIGWIIWQKSINRRASWSLLSAYNNVGDLDDLEWMVPTPTVSTMVWNLLSQKNIKWIKVPK